MNEDEFRRAIAKFALREGITFATLIASRERSVVVLGADARRKRDGERAQRKAAWLEREAHR